MQTELEVRVLSAEEFCARVIPPLSDREAENGLPFGIAQRLAAQPAAAQSALLLAVEAAGEVVAGAVWTPPHDIVVTRLPPGAAALVAEHCATWGLHPTGASGPEGSGLELAELLARQTSSAGRGYATALVAALSRQVLASGKRFACLFTDADNPTSNHIYESIGFRFVCRYDAYALVSGV